MAPLGPACTPPCGAFASSPGSKHAGRERPGDREGLVRLEDDIFIADTRVCHEGQVHLSQAFATVEASVVDPHDG
jgi:hypothetical protein